MQGSPVFVTQRTEVIDAYKAAGQAFRACTRPYKSSAFFTAEVQEADTTNGSAVVVFKPQEVELFGFGLGGVVEGAPAGWRKANESDTNQGKPRQTNGVDDFIIEGVSSSLRGLVIQYSAADAAQLLATTGGSVDDEAYEAVIGNGVIHDPGSHIVPPELQSPFNLEDPVLAALAAHVSVTFEWDRGLKKHIGTLDQIPEGGAKSYLRSHGEPTTMDRYKTPEGDLWRRPGQPDCDFVVRLTLKEAVCIPITLLDDATSAGRYHVPEAVYALLCMRLHGLAVTIPSRN